MTDLTLQERTWLARIEVVKEEVNAISTEFENADESYLCGFMDGARALLDKAIEVLVPDEDEDDSDDEADPEPAE